MSRLNIFVDETGEFGFNKRSSRLYGVSMVFHEQKNDITKEIELLEYRLGVLDFHGMIHMGDLVNGHGEFEGLSISERRKYYNILYRFAARIKAKYCTIIVDKQKCPNHQLLNQSIKNQISQLLFSNRDFFSRFERVIVYYDGGQRSLNKVIQQTVLRQLGAEQRVEFNHVEKKLFQVADMLTYVDKLIYKYNKRMKPSMTECAFFTSKQIRTIINELKSHRL